MLAGNHHPVAVFALLQLEAAGAMHQPALIRGALVLSPGLCGYYMLTGPNRAILSRSAASAAVAPRDTAMNNKTASLAARLADLQQRSRATDEAAAATLQQLQLQGQQLADAMTAAADAMESDLF